MPHPPGFWRHNGGTVLPRLLSPIAAAVAGYTARRMAGPGWCAPVPVICCGNATVGGAGKTTLALDILARLASRGLAVHALLRGYGGSSRGVRRVSAGDPASLAGDEALLLAAVAPTWTGADRAASARAALAAGAQALVMDDGLQNPTLEKSFSILTIDGAFGFGNGRVLPAGPLREPVAAGAARCHAAVLIGPDATDAVSQLPPGLAVLRARLVPGAEIAAHVGARVLAFAGIAAPEKFFAGLEQAGVRVAERLPFPDHHPFTERELHRIVARARALNIRPVTTPKDAVRIPAALRAEFDVIGVGLQWQDPSAIEALLSSLPWPKRAE
jgi:tetraacyldisaccharide 4'-kinase